MQAKKLSTPCEVLNLKCCWVTFLENARAVGTRKHRNPDEYQLLLRQFMSHPQQGLFPMLCSSYLTATYDLTGPIFNS